MVDLITNSSSETFIINASKLDSVKKDVLDVICKSCSSSYDDNSIKKLSESNYKDSYIFPEGMTVDDYYIADIDQNNSSLRNILENLFEVVYLEYKE